MVQAVLSATGRTDAYNHLLLARFQQASSASRVLDPQEEAHNLLKLFREIGVLTEIELKQVKSVSELEKLLSESSRKHVFVGLRAGSDTAPDIAHIKTRVDGGFYSDQQYIHEDDLVYQLME